MQQLDLKTIFATAALALGCAAIGWSQPAPAQTAGTARPPAGIQPIQTPAVPVSQTGNVVALPSKVAVISIQQAIMATKEGSAAGAALQQKYAPRQAEFEKRKADIEALGDQLKKGGAAMDEAAKLKLN